MDEEVPYNIVKATVEDSEKILHFLRQHFYNEEPINAAMNRDGLSNSVADEKDTLCLLGHDMSFLAVSNRPQDCGTLLGVCLSGPVTSNEAECMETLAATCGCSRYAKLLCFLAIVERRANVWSVSGVKRGLGVLALAVADTARGRGVGRALLARARDAAKDTGYPLFRMDCSSYFSARLAEQMGMHCVFSLPYSEFKNQNGCPVFRVEGPHEDMKIYIQKLS